MNRGTASAAAHVLGVLSALTLATGVMQAEAPVQAEFTSVAGLQVHIDDRGLQVRPQSPHGAGPWLRLSLAAHGRPGSMQHSRPAVLRAEGDMTRLTRETLTEWYRLRRHGLEQGFTVTTRPDGDGPLTLDIAVYGPWRAAVAGDRRSLLFHGEAPHQAVSYDGLLAWDAGGRDLPARLVADEDVLRIEVDDSGACYPLTIDPLMTAPHWVTQGNQVEGFFGWAAAAAGDVNGDGFEDVVVGQHLFQQTGVGAGGVPGRAVVYYGSPLGLHTSPAWSVQGWNTINESPVFAYAVAGAGDVNGDGYDDVIIGARNYTDDFRDGAAFIYFGSAAGLRSTPDWQAFGVRQLSEFGFAVAGAGDVNGDGFDDVLVGAPFTSGLMWEGWAFLYYGGPQGPSATADWVGYGFQSYAGLGWSLAGDCDLNGDGFDDLILGAYSASKKANPTINDPLNHGKIFVYYGAEQGPRVANGFSDAGDWRMEGDQGEAHLGQSVSCAGDVNGDGFDDILVAAYLYDEGEPDEGKVWVFHGGPQGLGADAAWTHQANSPGAQEGWRVGPAGDINGDGYDDVMVSAYKELVTYTQEGRVKLFLGGPLGLATSPVWHQDGGQPLALFADAVGPAGDVNGDGRVDLLLGTALYDMDTVDEGTVFVYLNTCGTVDFDGDGLAAAADPLCAAGELVDCNDKKASLMTPPGPVGMLTLAPTPAGGTTLTWEPPAIRGAPGLEHDVLRATSADGFGTGVACVEAGDATDTQAVDSAAPATPGTAFFYLVRALNNCPDGSGSLGWRSDGTPRNALACP